MKLKFIYSFVLFTIFSVSWLVSGCITSQRLTKLESAGEIAYGPLPIGEDTFYSYHSLEKAFDPKLDLSSSDKFSKLEFENIVLDSLPPQAKINFRTHIKETLALSVEYQVDPFWIISIMMVESGFDLKAKSKKNAQGLMQIQPETASHLHQLMGKNSENISQNSENNIDVGIFYLKKLYQNFHLNYKLATIAYNLGPNKLKNYIEESRDISKFSYLLKVQHCYKILESNYLVQVKERRFNTSQNLAYIPYRQSLFY